MAKFSSTSSFIFTFLFLALALTRVTIASIDSTSAASNQLNFWSNNVLNNMPESVLSKLSPLSKHDSDYFASLISKQSLSSDHAKFCSVANLACSVVSGKFHNLGNLYNACCANSTFLASDEVDPNSFFRLSILVQGNRVHLPDLNDQIPPRSFLPSPIASKISTSSSDLQKTFPDSFNSLATKQAIKTSLLYCSAPAIMGEIKSCPKSLEDMIEFSKKVLDVKQVVALTSRSSKGSGKQLIIGNIKQFDAENFVACHEIFLPFAAYLCHMESSTRLYAVDLIEPKTRAPVNKILATCHLDTSLWPQDHVVFKILKASPGQVEACHWHTESDLVWLANMENRM